MTQNNVLSIYQEVSTLTNRKIDNLFADVIHLPDIKRPPGMDLTAGGERLTYPEFQAIKFAYPTLVNERDEIQQAFRGTNTIVINKQVFYDITKRLGLFRIYPSLRDDDQYLTTPTAEIQTAYSNLSSSIDILQNQTVEKVKEAHPHWHSGKISRAVSCGSGIYGYLNVLGEGFLVLAIFLWIVFGGLTGSIVWGFFGALAFSFVLGLFLKDWGNVFLLKLVERQKEEAKTKIQLAKKTLSIQKIFPDSVISDQHRQSNLAQLLVKIKVADPPRDQLQKIHNALVRVPEKMRNGQITVADPKAIGILSYALIPAEIPPARIDPGVVVEYGHFAIILSDTFYHVSDLEQRFLNEALRIARGWEVKRYLLQ